MTQIPTGNTNPYEPPLFENGNSPATVPRFRWKLLPTALFGVLGGANMLLGIVALSAMVSIFVFPDHRLHIDEITPVCILYLGTGISWIIAALQYWKRRYTLAFAATVIGLAIRVILFSVIRF